MRGLHGFHGRAQESHDQRERVFNVRSMRLCLPRMQQRIHGVLERSAQVLLVSNRLRIQHRTQHLPMAIRRLRLLVLFCLLQ